MHWPQALVFAWMAISGLMEIALINKDLERIRRAQDEFRASIIHATDAARVRLAIPDADEELDREMKRALESTRNAESNAKWKSVGFIFRVFAVRLVILYALHSGGFF